MKSHLPRCWRVVVCREQERACESGKVAIDQYFLFERVLRYFTFHLIFSITSCSFNFALFVVGVLVLSTPHLDITSSRRRRRAALSWSHVIKHELNYKQDNIAFEVHYNSINQLESKQQFLSLHLELGQNSPSSFIQRHQRIRHPTPGNQSNNTNHHVSQTTHHSSSPMRPRKKKKPSITKSHSPKPPNH